MPLLTYTKTQESKTNRYYIEFSINVRSPRNERWTKKGKNETKK